MRVGLGLRVIVLTAVGAIVMLATTTASASAPGNGFAAKASVSRTVGKISSTTSCPLGAFCIWPSRNFTGTRDAFYTCGVNHPDPYPASQDGSWKNDQTPQNGSGPRVKMLAANGTVLYTTPPPWSSANDFDFSGIASFRIC